MNGKIALVTGGSRGIGRAIALQLAKDGCDVAVLYAGRREAADQTVSLLEAAGARPGHPVRRFRRRSRRCGGRGG